MEAWVIPLFTAIGGAAVALVGREILEWYKRPRLKIDFEERSGQKPYIINYNDAVAAAQPESSSTATYRIKLLRLRVRNFGKKPALNCEAKIKFAVAGAENVVYQETLLWYRHDPRLYQRVFNIQQSFSEFRKIFTPININVNDEELVTVLFMHYWYSHAPAQKMPKPLTAPLETTTFNRLTINPDTTAKIKISVSSSNARPASFSFNINWDGTVDGFNSENIQKTNAFFN